jgi:hypothetical protein
MHTGTEKLHDQRGTGRKKGPGAMLMTVHFVGLLLPGHSARWIFFARRCETMNDEVRKMREMLGLSQTELGALVGVTQGRIAQLEQSPKIAPEMQRRLHEVLEADGRDSDED